MIRFPCPNCGREYHLPEALARLALLCKGCGRSLTVPETSSEPEPFAEPSPDHLFDSPAGTVDLFPDSDTARNRAPLVRDIPDPQDSVDLFPRTELEPPPAAVVPQKVQPPEMRATATAAEPLSAGGRALELVCDVIVGLLLAGAGALLGEFATRRGTIEILREAGTAPKFPTVDLLVWLGCVAMPVLGYALFANRGKSVGAWLRRRVASR